MGRKTSTTTEAPMSADDFAAGLSNKLLHCRELGHNWRPFTVTWDKHAKCYDRRLKCPTCGTTRKQLLDQRGHVIRNGYDYADGYLAKNVERHSVSRDVFRVEAIVRFLDAHSEPKAG
jgi:hypothetical protein